MIGYECRKILRQSHFFFFLLCLIILNLGMLLSKNRIYQNVIEDNEAYYVGRGLLTERISGTIDQDKLDFLMTEYETIVSGSLLLIGRDTYTSMELTILGFAGFMALCKNHSSVLVV